MVFEGPANHETLAIDACGVSFGTIADAWDSSKLATHRQEVLCLATLQQ